MDFLVEYYHPFPILHPDLRVQAQDLRNRQEGGKDQTAETLLAEAASYLAGDGSMATLHHACTAFAETLIALRAEASPLPSPAASPEAILTPLPPPYPSQEQLDAALEPLCHRISSQLRLLDDLRAWRGGGR
jgi:hypothetical protein